MSNCVTMWVFFYADIKYPSLLPIQSASKSPTQKYSEMFSLEKRKVHGAIIAAFQYLKVTYKQEGDHLLTQF